MNGIWTYSWHTLARMSKSIHPTIKQVLQVNMSSYLCFNVLSASKCGDDDSRGSAFARLRRDRRSPRRNGKLRHHREVRFKLSARQLLRIESARGLAQSKTLREYQWSRSSAPAFWSVAALRRFSLKPVKKQ